jgi:hypothetical protein
MASYSYRYNIDSFIEQGQVPPAFTPELMPEWNHQEGMSFFDGMSEIEQYTESVHSYLDQERKPLEGRWKLCREYYDMDARLKQDKERLASIYAATEQVQDKELDLNRASLVHPIVYEAVQQQQSRLVGQLFGSGPRYIEMLGRQSNDIEGAKIYEEIANYQQEWQIPTLDIGDDVVNSGLVEGTGITCRQWDFQRNCPKDECINLLDYWFDPQGSYQHDDRWNVWRRYVTLGEMLTLRQQGQVYFTDEDMKSALMTTSDVRGRDYIKDKQIITTYKDDSNKPLEQQSSRWHEVISLDIFMQREGVERWVYRANKLIVAVTPNPVPSEDGIYRFPSAVYTPVRKKGSKYGDSVVYRMLDSQDMVNSLSYMMMSSMARTSLGMWFGDPRMYQGDDSPKPGVVNKMSDPKNNLIAIDMPDTSAAAIQAMTYVKREVADNISGVSEPTRGQQTSANQTASSVDMMLEQSSYRMRSMGERGKIYRKDYDSIGLLLNQRYLAPTTAFRITDQQGAWRPVEGADLHGVAGKDIMPTGFPIDGSNAQFTQQALNEVAVIQQTGGNPTEMMRKYLEIKYGGFIDVNEIYPELGKPGNDPRQENEMMAQGMPVMVDVNDDDLSHLMEHQPMILMMQQNGAPPQLVQGMMAHFQSHLSRYQQIQADNTPAGGGGSGTSGLNTQMPGPDPKQPGEIEAQMAARSGA